jgi:hypothetical protein
MPKGQRSYDWEALRLEWLQTSMTPHAFALSKNIRPAFFLTQ